MTPNLSIFVITFIINCLGSFGFVAPDTISAGAPSDEPSLYPAPTKAVDPEDEAALDDGSTVSAPDSLAFLNISFTRSAPAFFLDGPTIC